MCNTMQYIMCTTIFATETHQTFTTDDTINHTIFTTSVFAAEGDRRSSEGRVDVGIIQDDDKEDDDKEDDDKEDEKLVRIQ